MPKWSKRRAHDSLPEFFLTHHKQCFTLRWSIFRYLDYCQAGVEQREKERYLRMTTLSFHDNKRVQSMEVLEGVPDENDNKLKMFERKLQ
eukprot:1393725-Amorphochlora_amoeboformis.AAC.2